MSSKRIWGSLDPFLEPGPVLGRRVANSQFLAALLRADPFDHYHFFLADQGGRKDLAERLDGILPPDLRARVRVMDRRELPRALGRNSYHCFHQSDCIALQAHLSRLRNAYSRDVFPVTGPTHSLSYSNYAQAFLNHLWPGASKRDCVVATSRPGLRAVEALFRHLRQALDLPEERFPGPSLKVVPLGVDPDEFKTAPSPAGEGPVRLLVFGRISHYSKMDVLPLFRALQRLFADGLARDRVSLTLAGWVEEGDDFPETLKGLAANIGLDLRVVPRPSAEHKPGLYAAADIFVSIADNPQETFGLTVLEAGACGLACVVSDYDGYRDLVLDRETGFLVPTIGPARSGEVDMLAPLLFDNQYHLLLAQQTAVDVAALARVLKALIDSPRLRLDMGAAAKRRVLGEFSWQAVIKRYLDLWDELRQLPGDAPPDAAHPLHLPYAEVFASYPSRVLGPEIRLVSTKTGQAVYRDREFPLIYAGLKGRILAEAAKKLAFLARKPVPVPDLVQGLRRVFPDLSLEGAEAHILWALKNDLLEQA